MKIVVIRYALQAQFPLLSTSGFAQTSREQALNDPRVQKVLRAIGHASIA
ncbi:MAG TPA: hypothetical protein VN720_10830 [Rudaea sp.]|jgi:hypothetical protein|nr:hypothetical protein [Rudaea sp.]